MANAMCSRKQKRILQAVAFLVLLVVFAYGAMLHYDLQRQLRKVEAVAGKYQQHQESLSAQLQVVYEHRSRLEKSLQKERLEHKKAKEDYLVYKLEAQETLNKGRQDSNNRYNALSVQHQMLKNQHDDLRKQHSDLQSEHQKLGEDLTRAFSEHKEKYVQLQQEKEQELSKLKENVYNLHEENKQLRKAHQDVHTQLKDVKQQHKNLLSQHEQVVLSLDSHKSALAAAQGQVEEFMQLKEALNKMSSLRQTEKNTSTPERRNPPTETARKPFTPINTEAVNREVEQTDLQIHKDQHKYTVPYIRVSHEDNINLTGGKTGIVKSEELGPPKGTEPPTEHAVELEEEHKKEMEEEEMEQVGKPERLVEDQDQIQEEPDHLRHPEDEQRVYGNEEEQKEEETNMMQEQKPVPILQTAKPQNKFRSAYEEQLVQQQLAAQQEERARQLRQHQESLHQQRQEEHILRQKKMRELDLQQQNAFKEQLVEKIRKKANYDNMDQDIVQGEEGEHIQEEGGAYERDHHQDEAEDLDVAVNDGNEEEGLNQQAHSREKVEKAPAEDVNPADDPNNQGEDEFEEAEQEREENLPDENEQHRLQHQAPPEGQEHLVMAGNPDQQEDNIDDRYQDEIEEEVQEDLTEERKQEQNGEEPYGEHDENVAEKHIGAEREREAQHGDLKERNEDNYEEEEEEEEDGDNNQRAEM
uniref:Golgi integral membrane protein 4 n=1 Tax=Leptobrachium leishanense TaxID=445787 RepID=A0A8C5PP78_9ANUR